MREKLIALSMAKKGDWNQIYHFLSQDRDLSGIDEKAAIVMVNRLTCDTITIFDENYPKVLKDMSRPPFVLYYQGDLSLLYVPSVAVVGGKKPSTYTIDGIQRYFLDSKNIFSIVTGTEMGVEDAVFDVTSKRIVILGSGVEHAPKVFQKDDLILTEYPPAVKWTSKGHFRSYHLICELADAVTIFELPTSDIRLKYLGYLAEIGKPVFVYPDRDTTATKGGLQLVNRGARLLINRQEMLDLFLSVTAIY